MKLKELFQNLALGELAGSPFVELNGYELDETKLPRVIHAINQALTYIHTNFHLKQKQVVIQLNEAQGLYYLDSDYAISNHTSPYQKYILDTESDKFTDDVLQVLGVYGIDGTAFPLMIVTLLVQSLPLNIIVFKYLMTLDVCPIDNLL